MECENRIRRGAGERFEGQALPGLKGTPVGCNYKVPSRGKFPANNEELKPGTVPHTLSSRPRLSCTCGV